MTELQLLEEINQNLYSIDALIAHIGVYVTVLSGVNIAILFCFMFQIVRSKRGE